MAKTRVLVLSSSDHPEVLAEVAGLRKFFDVDYEHIEFLDRRHLKDGFVALTTNLREVVPALLSLRFPPFPFKTFAENILCASLLIKRTNARHQSYDVIYSNWLFPAGLAGLLLARILGSRTICVPRGYDIQALPGSRKYGISGYTRIISRYVLKRSDWIIAIHQVYGATAISLCGADCQAKITYMPSAVPDLSEIKVSRDELPPGVLEKLETSTRNVLYSPSLNPIYGVLDLISAAPIVMKKIPDVLFLITGQGSLENQIRSRIEKENLSANILMLGKVKYSVMLALYKTSDVVCDLAYFGSGTSTIEAFCFSKPVIGISSPKQYVTDGWDGFEVKVGDYTDLANKLIGLLSDDQLRALMSRNARQSYEEKFFLPAKIAKIQHLISSLAK